LAGIHRLALVCVKLRLNICTWGSMAGLELSVAPLAHSDGRRGPLYDAQLALLHDCSLAHLAGRTERLWKSNGTTTHSLVLGQFQFPQRAGEYD
jgi:hypothetical protein